jgi:zona occludens toxin
LARLSRAGVAQIVIELYTGTPGSGKSYHALRDGLLFASRRPVVANFPVTKPPKHWHYVENPTVRDLAKFSRTLPRGEGRALLIIDEAQRMFNARDWSARGERGDWVTFFTQHRKFGFDIILIVQADLMMDKQIRFCVENEVRHHKANRLWFLKFFPITTFLTVTYWYHTKLKGKMKWIVCLPWVAGRYDHLALFGDDRSQPREAPEGEGLTPEVKPVTIVTGDASGVARANDLRRNRQRHSDSSQKIVDGERRSDPQGSFDADVLELHHRRGDLHLHN